MLFVMHLEGKIEEIYAITLGNFLSLIKEVAPQKDGWNDEVIHTAYEWRYIKGYDMVGLKIPVHIKYLIDAHKVCFKEIYTRQEQRDEGGRKCKINFYSIGLKEGDELNFIPDSLIRCRVISNREVEYQGQIMSLSKLAHNLLCKTQGGSRTFPVRGPIYWTYNGET